MKAVGGMLFNLQNIMHFRTGTIAAVHSPLRLKNKVRFHHPMNWDDENEPSTLERVVRMKV